MPCNHQKYKYRHTTNITSQLYWFWYIFKGRENLSKKKTLLVFSVLAFSLLLALLFTL